MLNKPHDVTYSWSDDGWFQLNEHTQVGIHRASILRFRLDDHVSDGWTDSTFAARLVTREVDDRVVATLELTNASDDPQPVPAIVVEFGHDLRVANWFAAFFSYVVFRRVQSEALLVLEPEASGYAQDPGRHPLRAQCMLAGTVLPGGVVRTSWRGRWYRSADDARAAVTPFWYPGRAVVDEGETIEFELPDGVIDGEALRLSDDYPRTLVRADAGVHRARVALPVGDCYVALGWARPLTALVSDALASGNMDDDVRAWLLAWSALHIAPNDAHLDALDVAIAAALEDPTPFGIAAAADASPLLGRSLLSDAITGLEAIADEADDRDGTYLAAMHVWGQALVQDSTDADEVGNYLWQRTPNTSVEGGLLIDPWSTARVVNDLLVRAGFCFPGPVPDTDTYSLALLKLAVHGWLEGDQLALASWVHQTAEAWKRCTPLAADDLAWLLW